MSEIAIYKQLIRRRSGGRQFKVHKILWGSIPYIGPPFSTSGCC